MDYSLLFTERETATQHVRNIQQCWTKNHDKHGRKQKCSQRKQKFEGSFLCGLLRSLPSLGSKAVRINANGASDRSTKAICLNQHTDQAVKVFNTSAVSEVAQSFTAFATDANFEVSDLELFTDVGMNVLQFLAALQHRCVKTESGFHRDDHQIERIGEAPRDSQFSSRNQSVEY